MLKYVKVSRKSPVKYHGKTYQRAVYMRGRGRHISGSSTRNNWSKIDHKMRPVKRIDHYSRED